MIFTYSDDFCGIGGFRFAFDGIGGFQCLCSSEIDNFARITYEKFHGDIPEYKDINDSIECRPYVDLFVGGFSCQPFSHYGVVSNNYRENPNGFEHAKGTDFFTIAKILSIKKPKVFLLENVKSLLHHDKHKTFKIMQEILSSIGYNFTYKVINAADWGPQNRERVYIVGILNSYNQEYLDGILDIPKCEKIIKLSDILLPKIEDKYNITERTWQTLKKHKERHLTKYSVGFGYSLLEPPFNDLKTRTLVSSYYKSGAEILIWRDHDLPPRRLTPLECLRLQGFPKETEKWFDGTEIQPVSNMQAYIQFGNSVYVPVVTEIAKNIKTMMLEIL